MADELKTTPFQPIIDRLSAEMMEWTGYSTPNFFSDPTEEYHAIRQRLGVYDLTPLRKVEVKGPGALALAQRLVTRDIGGQQDGQMHYAPICDEQGGIVNDCTVYRFGPQHLWIIVGNLSDVEWIQDVARDFEVQAEHITDRLCNLAVQGRRSRDVLRTLVGPVIDGLKYYRFAQATIAGAPVVLSRSGYTGELGFELFLAPEHAGTIWDAVMDAGKADNILPCGFTSLDMVRVEYGLVFFGYDMDRSNNPFEVWPERMVTLSGPDFIGKEALQAIKARGVSQKLVGLEIDAPAALGGGTVLDQSGNEVGKVTSPQYSPLLKKSIALAMVQTAHAADGLRLTVDDGDARHAATVARTPFYDYEKKLVRS